MSGRLILPRKLPRNFSKRKLFSFGRKQNPGLFQKGYTSSEDFISETNIAINEIDECVKKAVNSGPETVVDAIDTLSNRICLTAGKKNLGSLRKKSEWSSFLTPTLS